MLKLCEYYIDHFSVYVILTEKVPHSTGKDYADDLLLLYSILNHIS